MFDGFYLFKEMLFSRIFLIDRFKNWSRPIKKKIEIFILMLRAVYELKYGYNACLSIY